MTHDIEGIWSSRYEYGKGAADEPSVSEHRIRFVRTDDGWEGASLPNEENSKVTFKLSQNGNEFSGTWRERTAPYGPYKGREYHGLILLLLQGNDRELKGMWIGAGSSANRVKCGVWVFERGQAQV